MNARKWMLFAALFTEIVGIAMVAGALIPGFFDPILSLVFGTQLTVDATARFGLGIAGAIMTGWAATIAMLSRATGSISFQQLGSAVAVGVVTWFVLDGIVSVLTGAPLNLIGNTLFLAVLLPPALALRASDRAGSAAGRREAAMAAAD